MPRHVSPSIPINIMSGEKANLESPTISENVAPGGLRVGSLNIWGLYTSKNRKTRLAAIAALIKDSDYAVVGLQEVWVRRDYEYLAETLSGVFPFSYYFKSGQMGSGVATFSRYPIKQAMFHRFLLNGQAHHIWHGDWWSGKGVGLTRIEVAPDVTLNFYNTHLHAEYNKKTNWYLGHRITQLQQLLQFVQMSSAVQDTTRQLNVVAGDLNTLPECFSFDLFFHKDIIRVGLHDAATLHAEKHALPVSNTFNLAHNTYSKPKQPEQRIDYIMFRGSDTIALRDFSVLSEDRLAGSGKLSLSDHAFVSAEFDLNAPPMENPPLVETSVDEETTVIKQAIAVLSKDIYYTKRSQTLHKVFSVVQLLLFLAVTAGVSLILTFSSLPLFVTLLAFIIAPGLLIGAILSGIIAGVWLPDELAHLHGFASQWNLALLARGMETLPVAGIVEAMQANPEAIEQMCTVTGQKFDKALIKQLLQDRRGAMKAARLADPARDFEVIPVWDAKDAKNARSGFDARDARDVLPV